MKTTEATSPIVTPTQAVEQAQLAFKAGRIFHVEGKGGGGKTSILKKDLAEAMDIPPNRVYLCNMSGMGPQEMLGYGIVDNGNRELYFSKPEQWPHQDNVGSDHCLLILDEITNWDHGSLSLCRSLVDPVDGIPRIGTHELGSNVHICMTSNRAQDGSRSMVLDAPFVSRSLTVTLEPTLDGFLDWAAAKGYGLSPIWHFLKYANGLNECDHFNPPLPDRWDGAPHPTPRGWEAALSLTCDPALDLLDKPSTLDVLLRGLVGNDAGAAANAFCYTVANQLALVDDIRSGRDYMPTSDKPAEQYAVLFAALRQAKKESEQDPSAHVAAGNCDWLVDKFICSGSLNGELRAWAYRTAVNVGIPLHQHSRSAEMIGV